MARRGIDTALPSPPELHAGNGNTLRRIVVPVDSFGRSTDAIAAAVGLAALAGGQLRLVHVRIWDPGPAGGRFCYESSGEATTVLADALDEAWERSARASGVVVEAPRRKVGAAIAAQAEIWGADAIVLSRRRRFAIGMLLLGSVTNEIMRQASCPVVVVRQTATSGRPAARS